MELIEFSKNCIRRAEPDGNQNENNDNQKKRERERERDGKLKNFYDILRN